MRDLGSDPRLSILVAEAVRANPLARISPAALADAAEELVTSWEEPLREWLAGVPAESPLEPTLSQDEWFEVSPFEGAEIVRPRHIRVEAPPRPRTVPALLPPVTPTALPRREPWVIGDCADELVEARTRRAPPRPRPRPIVAEPGEDRALVGQTPVPSFPVQPPTRAGLLSEEPPQPLPPTEPWRSDEPPGRPSPSMDEQPCGEPPRRRSLAIEAPSSRPLSTEAPRVPAPRAALRRASNKPGPDLISVILPTAAIAMLLAFVTITVLLVLWIQPWRS